MHAQMIKSLANIFFNAGKIPGSNRTMKIANLQYAITSNVIHEITWQNGNRRQDDRLCLEKCQRHIKTILIYIRHSIQHMGLMHGLSKQQGTIGVLRVLVLY